MIGYIIIIIFCAFRVIDYDIGGIDVLVYKIRFETANLSLIQSLKNQNNEYEYGYGIMVWFILKLSNNYSIFLNLIYLSGQYC